MSVKFFQRTQILNVIFSTFRCGSGCIVEVSHVFPTRASRLILSTTVVSFVMADKVW